MELGAKLQILLTPTQDWCEQTSSKWGERSSSGGDRPDVETGGLVKKRSRVSLNLAGAVAVVPSVVDPLVR